MKRATKRLLASWIVAMLVALAAFGGYTWYVYVATDPARKARRLWAELRPPGRIELFLIEIGIKSRSDRRDETEIVLELGALGPPAVPYLIRVLDRKDERVCCMAAQHLEWMGPDHSAAAIPALVRVVDDTSRLEHTRFVAARALVKLGETGKGVSFLSKTLRSVNPLLRHFAATALRDLGPAAAPAIPNLIATLADVIRPTRDKASDALARIGPPAVPALAKALEHPDSTVRGHAAWALGEIGPGAAAATAALERARKDESTFVRDIAAKALKRIQAKGE
jgi:HEAT repeat protein